MSVACALVTAAFDHAQIADHLPGLHLALLDDVVLVDHEHIAAALIGAERNVGHQQSRSRLRRNAHAHEVTGQQRVIAVFQSGARRQRAGRGIDVGRHVIELALVRIAGFGLQPDFDGKPDQRRRRLAAARQYRSHLQHVAFARREIHPDRIELHDRRQRGR